MISRAPLAARYALDDIHEYTGVCIFLSKEFCRWLFNKTIDHFYTILVESVTLWGEREQVHVQNVEQLYALSSECDCMSTVQPQATEYHTKSTLTLTKQELRVRLAEAV